MIVILIFFILSNILLNIQANNIDFKHAWSQYKLLHNRLYHDVDDDLRFNIWINNLNFINEHNKKFKNGLVSFSLKMNEFGDMTKKEFEAKQNGVDKGLKRRRLALKKSKKNNSFEVPEHISAKLLFLILIKRKVNSAKLNY